MGKFFEGLYQALTLHVRHAAWLHAVPEPKGGKRIQGAPPPLSRLNQIYADRKASKDDNRAIDMPPCDGVQYLVTYLWDVGPTINTPMGEAPVSHTEIAHWQDNTGVELDSWEATFLRKLSREYLAQAQLSVKPDCPPPWGIIERRAMVARKIDEIFG